MADNKNRATQSDIEASNDCLQSEQYIWYTLPIAANLCGVVRKMQIKRRTAPTIDGVFRQLKEFEFRYHISTEDFVREDSSANAIGEDDAMEWRYLREQYSALQEDAIERIYSTLPTGNEARLNNCEDSSELLAA